MHRICVGAVALLWLVSGAGAARAQERTDDTVIAEEIEPRVIGTTGTTTLGFSGHLDRFASSERSTALNYAAQFDVARFLTRRIAARGGLAGTGSFGGDDADERPTGTGAPALHAFAGALYYFTPRSMLSPYAGAEYWAQVTQRAGRDAGSLVAVGGVQGAISSRASLFLEAGYGIGLTRGEDGETLSRVVGRIGVRLKL